MIAKVIQIGNSKGIRIPNHILKEMNIENQIELTVSKENNTLILKPLHSVREGWDKAFAQMSAASDDTLIIDDSIDIDDWEW